MPLVGFIDSERALLLTGKLLEAIAAKRARAVVLDITGVPAVDFGGGQSPDADGVRRRGRGQ